ncbi:MAG: hypothetical protein ACPHL6_08510 [Rubripirellula sp.]
MHKRPSILVWKKAGNITHIRYTTKKPTFCPLPLTIIKSLMGTLLFDGENLIV